MGHDVVGADGDPDVAEEVEVRRAEDGGEVVGEAAEGLDIGGDGGGVVREDDAAAAVLGLGVE